VDLIALNIHDTLRRSDADIVLAPTVSGATARSISRFRLPVWIVGFSCEQATCQNLQFSYGVLPVAVDDELDEWLEFVCRWTQGQGLDKGVGILVEGRQTTGHSGSHRFELVELGDCL